MKRVVLVMLMAGVVAGQQVRFGELLEGDLVVTNAPDYAEVEGMITNEISKITAGSIGVDTNRLNYAVKHAETNHGVQRYGGFSGGRGATTEGGGAIGDSAVATYGSASGYYSTAAFGGASGAESTTTSGGAVGWKAAAGKGFAGGERATTIYGVDELVDSIQLGTGNNPNPNTMRVYNYELLDYNGQIPTDRMNAVIQLIEDIPGADGIFTDIATEQVYHIVVSNGHWLIRYAE